MTHTGSTTKLPAWITSQIAAREAATYAGTVVTRTLDEHLSHEATCVSYVNGLRTVNCTCQH